MKYVNELEKFWEEKGKDYLTETAITIVAITVMMVWAAAYGWHYAYRRWVKPNAEDFAVIVLGGAIVVFGLLLISVGSLIEYLFKKFGEADDYVKVCVFFILTLFVVTYGSNV